MRIVITGGDGLARGAVQALLARPDVREVHLVDPAPIADLADARIHRHRVDALALGGLVRLLPGTDAILHLAEIPPVVADADFDRGLAANLDGTRAVLEAARAAGTRPRLVFASTLAAARPETAFATAKAMGELLVAEYSRRGYVDGRAIRLPTILVRPEPYDPVSDFAGALIRDALAGRPAVCPVDADAELCVLSLQRAVDGLLHALDLAAWGDPTAVASPGLTMRVGDLVAALAGPVELRPDRRVEAAVRRLPARVDAAPARALGFPSDPDAAAILRQYTDGR